MTRRRQAVKKRLNNQDTNEKAVVLAKNVQTLKDGLGFDIQNLSPESAKTLVATFNASVSSCPYPSAEMLQEYRDRGFSEMVGKVIDTIDRQTQHRQNLEKSSTLASIMRQYIGQVGALIIAIIGTCGSLFMSYKGASPYVCIAVCLASIGGPSTATVLTRVLDRIWK